MDSRRNLVIDGKILYIGDEKYLIYSEAQKLYDMIDTLSSCLRDCVQEGLGHGSEKLNNIVNNVTKTGIIKILDGHAIEKYSDGKWRVIN